MEAQLDDQTMQLEELEDELQSVEDAKLRLEVSSLDVSVSVPPTLVYAFTGMRVGVRKGSAAYH